MAEMKTSAHVVSLVQGMKTKLKCGSCAYGLGVWIEAPGEAGYGQ